MTPAEEAEFIQLWQADMKTAAIAQVLGIPRGRTQGYPVVDGAAVEGPNRVPEGRRLSAVYAPS